MCMGKLWCGLCEVTPSVSRTRGWLERPCILLCGWCSSLNRSLVGSGVVVCCLGKLVREKSSHWKLLKTWAKPVSLHHEMGEWDGRALWRCGLQEMHLRVSERAVPWWVNSRNKMWGSFEATETSVLGEEVMNSRKTVHETILFLNIRLCSLMFPYACSLWTLLYILISSPCFVYVCVLYPIPVVLNFKIFVLNFSLVYFSNV